MSFFAFFLTIIILAAGLIGYVAIRDATTAPPTPAPPTPAPPTDGDDSDEGGSGGSDSGGDCARKITQTFPAIKAVGVESQKGRNMGAFKSGGDDPRFWDSEEDALRDILVEQPDAVAFNLKTFGDDDGYLEVFVSNGTDAEAYEEENRVRDYRWTTYVLDPPCSCTRSQTHWIANQVNPGTMTRERGEELQSCTIPAELESWYKSKLV